ncbi:hypothetical protein RGQ29_017021 [Quercus rubra]|uniref:non-specific serine/threonine protein kinase n=1 Tax=Quercus rubra TaxID=3512 RepID=A0AAN7ISQ6_QUERU|nr:hypothetical protein RGQ29_017021 [Quercus rubra]
MLHPITSSPLNFFLFLSFLSVATTTSFADDECYHHQPFDCGPFKNLSYPFTSAELQPSYCGPPELRLTNCAPTDSPELTISPLTYQLLRLNQADETMTLARSDLWNNTCLLRNQFTNSTVLNSTILNYTTDNEDLTIYYGCFFNYEVMRILPSNLFNCSSINEEMSASFYMTNPTDPILNITTCYVGVRLKILQTAAFQLTSNQASLREVLMEGFNVTYNSNCISQPCTKQPGYSSKWWNRSFKGVVAGIAGTIAVIFVMIICYLKREQLSNMGVISKKKTKDNQYAKAFVMNQGSLAPKQYSYSDIKKMTHSFKNKLGQGGFGSVYKGKLLDDRLVAVKVINELKGNGEEFINEVASISRTSHVNIVTLLGYCCERTKRVLVYEFMPNGSLDKFICNPESSSTNCQLEQKTLFKIAVSVAQGLEYLHCGCSTRILHFDIKPQNILLDDDFCPKISDFGLAKLCQKKESIVSMLGARGTIGYIAPEVFSRNFGGVSHKSDVYSYGMLILEMVGVNKNFDAEVSHTSERYFPDWIYQNLNLGENIENNTVMIEEDEQMKRKMILVGMWCIQTIPTNRPSMTKVVEMLEGNVHSIEIPPKPFLFSPTRSVQYSSSTSLP